MQMATRILVVILLYSLTNSLIIAQVDSSIFGTFKLIQSESGNCFETLKVEEKKGRSYSVWLTFYDESESFIANQKLDSINKPLIKTTTKCHSAGPAIPFCRLIIKKVVKYDREARVLKHYYGKKKSFKDAEFKFTKLEYTEDTLRITRLAIKKAMPSGVFNVAPLEIAATDISPMSLRKVEENSKCSYDKVE